MTTTSYSAGWAQAERDYAAGVSVPFSATRAQEATSTGDRDYWDGYAARTWQLSYGSCA